MPELDKVIKNLPTGFKDDADAMTEQQLRNCIVESEHNLQTAVKGMEDNSEYQKLKTAYKEASEPLRDAKKTQKAKIAYCLNRLEELGKL